MFYNPKPFSDTNFSFPSECNYLKLNGFWPTPKDSKNRYVALAIKIWSMYVIFEVGLTIYFQSTYLVLTIGDLMKVTENCCTTFMGVMNFLRLIHFKFNQDKFRKLLDMFVNEIWILKGTNVKVEAQCRSEMKIVRVMAIMNLLLILMYIVLPMVQLFLNTEKYRDAKPFPYEMIFFYDANHGVSYVLTYIFTSHAGWCVVTTLLAEDAIFGFFVTYTCGQFIILHRAIRNVVPDGYNVAKNNFGLNKLTIKSVQNEYHHGLSRIAKRHASLLEFCKLLDEFMSPILLANFVISSILICMVGFQIVTGKDMFIGDYVKFLIYIFALLTQLLVLCWNGDRLIQISTKTGFALYSCNWEGEIIKDMVSYCPTGPAFIREVSFMMARSNRCAHVTAFKFSVVSLQSFTKILSTAMSYFALLMTFVDDKPVYISSNKRDN